jgi:hypothetical protein
MKTKTKPSPSERRGLGERPSGRELPPVHLAVKAPPPQELLRRAVLHDASTIQHEDAIEGTQGRQPMRSE